jgi:DDE superfamily endonuclease
MRSRQANQRKATDLLSDSTMTTVQKRTQPNFQQKASAVARAKEIGLKPAARELHIPVSTLKRWRKQALPIRQAACQPGSHPGGTRRLPGGGRKSTIPIDTQKKLLEYLEGQREIENNKVTVPMMVEYLRTLDDGAYSNVEPVILRRRIWRILHRNKVSLRHQDQNTGLCDKVIADWVEYIQQKMTTLGISQDCIANFDKMPVAFSPKKDASVTLDRQGRRKAAGAIERCTTMIGVAGDGYKFPPFIIFKASQVGTMTATPLRQIATEQATSMDGEYRGVPLSNFYSAQPKAWMDKERMLEWVDKVWKPWTASKGGRPTMLILDEFNANRTDEVRQACEACGTCLEFVPGCYTSRLQVVHAGINTTFKDRVRDQYNAWLRTGVPSGSKPQRSDVATWIAKSWLDLPTSAVANAWNRLGLLSNLLDGPTVVVEEDEDDDDEGDFLAPGIYNEDDDDS